MSPDSYYDPPEDVIQHISECIAEYMLKDVPDDESRNDRDCEIIEAIAQKIHDDDELSDAFQSYFMRKGKPPVVKRDVYEEANGLYGESPCDSFNEHQRSCLAFSLTYCT